MGLWSGAGTWARRGGARGCAQQGRRAGLWGTLLWDPEWSPGGGALRHTALGSGSAPTMSDMLFVGRWAPRSSELGLPPSTRRSRPRGIAPHLPRVGEGLAGTPRVPCRVPCRVLCRVPATHLHVQEPWTKCTRHPCPLRPTCHVPGVLWARRPLPSLSLPVQPPWLRTPRTTWGLVFCLKWALSPRLFSGSLGDWIPAGVGALLGDLLFSALSGASNKRQQ